MARDNFETNVNINLITDSWRIFRILSEFVDGFEIMSKLGPSVSIFGSARTQPHDPNYLLTEEVARKIVNRGFSIITGGGPGMMEAANKGAQDASGGSCGLVIDLPFESESNPFIDPEFEIKFRYFFVRKVMFIRYAVAFIFMPGGFGTCDELFEVLTLIQTQKIANLPIYLMGSDFWGGMLKWIKEVMIKRGTISEGDLNLFKIIDSPEQVARDIEENYRVNLMSKHYRTAFQL